MDRHRS